MLAQNPELSKLIQAPDVRKRLLPYLDDDFDPISLQRPGFLADLGFDPETGELLKSAALGRTWLTTLIFYRALAEEIRATSNSIDNVVDNFAAFDEAGQWKIASETAMRMHFLLTNQPQQAAVIKELGIKPEDYSALRGQWETSVASNPKFVFSLALAVQLRLMGTGFPIVPLKAPLQLQSSKTYFWFFKVSRPILSKIEVDNFESIVDFPSPINSVNVYKIRESMANEIKENGTLTALLWMRQWMDYLQKHRRLTQHEFRCMLDHFEDAGRNSWPDMAAGPKGKPKRAVAIVATELLEAIAEGNDNDGFARLFRLITNFNEQHDMKAVLKRRFGI